MIIKPNVMLFFFIFFYLLLKNISLAQELPNIKLPSPESRELNKYIDFPVDISTGVPSVNIPIYNIKVKGITIPIALNYHASGIKHGQDDGHVGLGWTLSCNYRVSRIIKGQADSKDVQMNPQSYKNMVQNWDNTLNILPTITNPSDISRAYPFRNRDQYLGKFFPASGSSTYPFSTGPLLDGEYDNFNYISPNAQGSFIITDRVNRVVKEINPGLSKFNYIEGNATNSSISGIIGFQIKDADQNVYSFGEYSDKLGDLVLESNINALDNKNATAWALTNIETKFGENIKFNYQKKYSRTKYKRQLDISAMDPLLTPEYWNVSVENESQSSNYSIFCISSIITDNEIIEFIYDNNTIALKYISVKRKSDNSELVKVNFNYHTKSILPDNYRFLDSVVINSINSVDQKYGFKYYDEQHYYAGFLVNKQYVPDQWGYNKLESSGFRLIHNEFGNDYLVQSGNPMSTNRVTPILYNLYSGYLTNRMENDNPELFSLKKIIYPTGGATLYEYEPNKNGYEYLGGIRVKSISHFDDSNTDNINFLNLKMKYEYDGGYNRYALNFNDFQNEYPQLVNDTWTAIRGINYSSQAKGAGNELPINTFYTKVSESLYSNSDFNGKTSYQFEILSSTMADASLYRTFINSEYMLYKSAGPRYVSNYSYKSKPNLLFKESKNKSGKLLKREKYSYELRNSELFEGLKVEPYLRGLQHANFNDPWFYMFVSSIYNYGLYTTEIGNSLISQKTEINYFDSDSLLTTVNYLYNSKNQINTESVYDSKGNLKQKVTLYPIDMPSSSVNATMINNNDLNKKLEQIVKINNNVIDRVVFDYSVLPNNKIELYKTKKWNPILQSFEDNFTIEKYDDSNNILTLINSNGTRVSYLWSYKKQFPIAEIIGSDYQTIESLLGGAISINNFSNLTNPNKSSIDAFVSPILSAISNGTIASTTITIYSYDPIFGIKTETDPSGRTKYYEYDNLGRLISISGDNQNIEKVFHYNYRNP